MDPRRGVASKALTPRSAAEGQVTGCPRGRHEADGAPNRGASPCSRSHWRRDDPSPSLGACTPPRCPACSKSRPGHRSHTTRYLKGTGPRDYPTRNTNPRQSRPGRRRASRAGRASRIAASTEHLSDFRAATQSASAALTPTAPTASSTTSTSAPTAASTSAASSPTPTTSAVAAADRHAARQRLWRHTPPPHRPSRA
jgi:hypothetical protein